MSASKWALLVAFAATIWGVSFVSPEGAVMLGGFVAVVLLVESGALQQITQTIGG